MEKCDKNYFEIQKFYRKKKKKTSVSYITIADMSDLRILKRKSK